MNSFLHSRRTVLVAGLFVVLSALSVTPVAGEGTLLTSFDVTAFTRKPVYFPIGVTFDGSNLWYSQPSISSPGIFETTPTGTVLNRLSLVFPTGDGALAWDGSNLWVASFGGTGTGPTSLAYVFEVNPANGGTVLKTLNLTSIFAPDVDSCGIIDGLAYDSSSGTLWVSPDVGCNFSVGGDQFSPGFVYQIDTSGNLLKRIEFPSFSVSGVAFSGKSLYVADRFGLSIDRVTPDGSVVFSFPIAQVDPGVWPESLAFDPSTFASCAIWVMQPYIPSHITGITPTLDHADLAAYSIPC